jgi:hypothetical protein
MWFPKSIADSSRLSELVPHRRYRRIEPRIEPRSRLELPIGLLGMLALVVGFEVHVARHWWSLTDPAAFGWAHNGLRAKLEGPGSEIICAGDSLIQVGLIPRIIEAGTGRVAINLGAGSAPAVFTDLVLRRAFVAGAKPVAIIFDLEPNTLSHGPEHDIRFWQEFLAPLRSSHLQ